MPTTSRASTLQPTRKGSGASLRSLFTMIPQLSVAPPNRPSRYALVRTVSQVVLRIERNDADPLRVIQTQILDWIARKAGRPLPREAWDGKTFELDDIGAQRVSAAALDAPRYWSARV